ncbi:response regulator [Rhodospirillum rubrum]|uniref:Response regulator receiver domain protein (CheY) n=1 Tax=Rhodospirillum rubrum (strain ATCC 11170 / ATH 1.1.1 / DSM 467 / LMG 4362 / NCIMB 8255 / S1) TaxID=269796 RepID=Q2RS61_RHORT|nr:response regulator [Rhodospirillum rubrum]ABC23034.1 Response regulator receiver domain protein (CheY) [Rhodospirillum rubrum ATCC 11170]AEO48763.1 response regulator receiver domain-containing protein [Rhodospirillum rubrum F11]MBK5954661.1 response regulator [Rhodospirillum rubrum]QXG79018.1 response regulator [Rhodospirillum rubrum]
MPNGKTVLIVDDDTNVRKAIRLGVEELGWAVVEACDGEEGLRLLGERMFDLVVSDVWMPKVDGISFLKHAMEIRPGLKVLSVSGGGTAPAALSLKMTEMYGASDILFKPFTPNELLGKLSALMADEPALD